MYRRFRLSDPGPTGKFFRFEPFRSRSRQLFYFRSPLTLFSFPGRKNSVLPGMVVCASLTSHEKSPIQHDPLTRERPTLGKVVSECSRTFSRAHDNFSDVSKVSVPRKIILRMHTRKASLSIVTNPYAIRFVSFVITVTCFQPSLFPLKQSKCDAF